MELKAASARGLTLFYEKPDQLKLDTHRPPPLNLPSPQPSIAEQEIEPEVVLNPLPSTVGNISIGNAASQLKSISNETINVLIYRFLN